MRISALNILLLAISSILLSGCAGAVLAGGAAAGAGTVVYINGELKSELSSSIDSVWQATNTAIREMELEPISREKDALTARLKAKGANDKDVYINMKSLTENSTEIRIRIDVFGDKTMSKRILSEIKDNL